MSRRGLPDTNPANPAGTIVNPTPRPSAAAATDPPTPAAQRQRTKLTVQLPAEVVDELRDAVVYLPTQGVQATVAGLVTQALEAELVRLREQHCDGYPFPARNTEPRPGRPISR